MSLDLDNIVRIAKEKGSSDIHIAPESPLMIRVDGELIPVTEEYLKPEETEELAKSMLSQKHWNILLEKGEVDCSHSVPGCARMRVNAFREKGGYAMVFRLLAVEIPRAESLGIPSAVLELTDKRRGLVLVTGATGSGKSTTLAAMIDIIARKYSKNIITLEDPIEYVHSYQKSAIVQREIGQDTDSYANALRAALRQDPDVILVGEMRDLETISTAITAAETIWSFQHYIPIVRHLRLTV